MVGVHGAAGGGARLGVCGDPHGLGGARCGVVEWALEVNER